MSPVQRNVAKGQSRSEAWYDARPSRLAHLRRGIDYREQMYRRGLLVELYGSFVATLPEALHEAARALWEEVGLGAPESGFWSDTVRHDVTWAAPVIVAEAMDVAPRAVDDATLAHILAMIEACAVERIKSGALRPSREFSHVLGWARRARDEAIARVWSDEPEARPPFGLDASYVHAALDTARAMASARAVVAAGERRDISTYEDLAYRKWRVALPASLVLAHVAGWEGSRCELLHHTLASIWIGIQITDDVVNWERDFARGGAWPVILIEGRQAPLASYLDRERSPFSPEAPTEGMSLKKRVYSSGILGILLSEAKAHFRRAASGAERLGATELALWTRNRAHYVETLVNAEAAHAGYAVRAHLLAPWAAEVLL